MIHNLPNEKWKELEFDSRPKLRYAISNYGRFVSFTDSMETGNILKCSRNKGYKMFKLAKYIDGKPTSKSFYIHKLVAEFFLPPKEPNKDFVIHLDYVKDNNHVNNLRWASRQEVEKHQNKNPKVIKDRKRLQKHNQMNEYKLNEAKVKILKRKLADPNRKTRLKMIARQFGISEMQLHRIKTGENWGHVKI